MPIILGIAVFIEFPRLRKRLDKKIGKIEKDVASLKGREEETDQEKTLSE